MIDSLGSVWEEEDCDQFEIPFDSQILNQYKTNVIIYIRDGIFIFIWTVRAKQIGSQ